MAAATVPGPSWPRKKPQHKLTLGRGWKGRIFPKTDYLPSPPLPPPPHTLTFSPSLRQAVPLAAVSTMQIPERRGWLECIWGFSASMHCGGRRGRVVVRM